MVPLRSAAVLLVVLAACNGNTVVTLTSTPSTDTFLTYRVGLVSVQLHLERPRRPSSAHRHHGGSRAAGELERSARSDIDQDRNFKQAVVTLDFSSAQIVYDNGTPEGWR